MPGGGPEQYLNLPLARSDSPEAVSRCKTTRVVASPGVNGGLVLSRLGDAGVGYTGRGPNTGAIIATAQRIGVQAMALLKAYPVCCGWCSAG